MVCPKCGSENVNANVVNEVQIKNKHKGIMYWLFVGWWWEFIKWVIFTVPALIVAIFAPKKKKIKNTQKTVCVCQNCGHRWDVE